MRSEYLTSTLIDPDSVFSYPKFVSVLEKILENKSQTDLAKEANLSNATISRILTGARTGRPHKSTIDKIASALDDPDLIAELYDATGYSDEKIKERNKIIEDNGFSPDLTVRQTHKQCFDLIIRSLTMLNSVTPLKWSLKSGTPLSRIYLIELEHPDVKYWCFRYIDAATSDRQRENLIRNAYGEIAQLNLDGNAKISFVTPCAEDFDFYVSAPPFNLALYSTIILLDSPNDRFLEESVLKTTVTENDFLSIGDICKFSEYVDDYFY